MWFVSTNTTCQQMCILQIGSFAQFRIYPPPPKKKKEKKKKKRKKEKKEERI